MRFFLVLLGGLICLSWLSPIEKSWSAMTPQEWIKCQRALERSDIVTLNTTQGWPRSHNGIYFLGHGDPWFFSGDRRGVQPGLTESHLLRDLENQLSRYLGYQREDVVNWFREFFTSSRGRQAHLYPGRGVEVLLSEPGPLAGLLVILYYDPYTGTVDLHVPEYGITSDFIQNVVFRIQDPRLERLGLEERTGESEPRKLQNPTVRIRGSLLDVLKRAYHDELNVTSNDGTRATPRLLADVLNPSNRVEVNQPTIVFQRDFSGFEQHGVSKASRQLMVVNVPDRNEIVVGCIDTLSGEVADAMAFEGTALFTGWTGEQSDQAFPFHSFSMTRARFPFIGQSSMFWVPVYRQGKYGVYIYHDVFSITNNSYTYISVNKRPLQGGVLSHPVAGDPILILASSKRLSQMVSPETFLDQYKIPLNHQVSPQAERLRWFRTSGQRSSSDRLRGLQYMHTTPDDLLVVGDQEGILVRKIDRIQDRLPKVHGNYLSWQELWNLAEVSDPSLRGILEDRDSVASDSGDIFDISSDGKQILFAIEDGVFIADLFSNQNEPEKITNIRCLDKRFNESDRTIIWAGFGDRDQSVWIQYDVDTKEGEDFLLEWFDLKFPRTGASLLAYERFRKRGRTLAISPRGTPWQMSSDSDHRFVSFFLPSPDAQKALIGISGVQEGPTWFIQDLESSFVGSSQARRALSLPFSWYDVFLNRKITIQWLSNHQIKFTNPSGAEHVLDIHDPEKKLREFRTIFMRGVNSFQKIFSPAMGSSWSAVVSQERNGSDENRSWPLQNDFRWRVDLMREGSLGQRSVDTSLDSPVAIRDLAVSNQGNLAWIPDSAIEKNGRYMMSFKIKMYESSVKDLSLPLYLRLSDSSKLSFSGDGTILLVNCVDGESGSSFNQVYLLGTQASQKGSQTKILRTINFSTPKPSYLALSSDGQFLAQVIYDGWGHMPLVASLLIYDLSKFSGSSKKELLMRVPLTSQFLGQSPRLDGDLNKFYSSFKKVLGQMTFIDQRQQRERGASELRAEGSGLLPRLYLTGTPLEGAAGIVDLNASREAGFLVMEQHLDQVLQAGRGDSFERSFSTTQPGFNAVDLSGNPMHVIVPQHVIRPRH